MAQVQLVHETEVIPSPRRMRSSSVRIWAALTTGGIAAAATMALTATPAALADPFGCFPPGPDQPWWANCADGATLDNGNTFHINKDGYKWETTPGGVDIPIDHPLTLPSLPHGPIVVNPDVGTMPFVPDPMPDLNGCPPYCVPVMVPNPSGR